MEDAPVEVIHIACVALGFYNKTLLKITIFFPAVLRVWAIISKCFAVHILLTVQRILEMSEKKVVKVMLSQIEEALEERQNNDRRKQEKSVPVTQDRRKQDRRSEKITNQM